MICTYKDVTYALIRSGRKTMSIYVEPDGSVIVRAPKNVSDEQINAIVDFKRYWIHESISEFNELNKTKVVRQIVGGEGFLFMGKSYRLRIDGNNKKGLVLDQGYFVLNENEIDKARQCFIDFYREFGKEHISRRVRHFEKKFGVKTDEVRVMDLKTRWASRGKKSLNFHWKIMLAPTSVIDYVIIHELAHYVREDHTPAFWEMVESVMPNYREKKEWLRLNGANLDI